MAPQDVAAELGRLRAPAFAVLGNHDWANDGPGIWEALRGAGVRVLENEVVALSRGLRLAGVADATQREPDLRGTLEGVEDPILLMSHDPDVFPHVPARIALTVSGHTHGGQVDLPLLRRRAIPSRHGDRYARGHVVEDGRHLFVTSGIGTSRWPIRLRRPPEIVRLELRAVAR